MSTKQPDFRTGLLCVLCVLGSILLATGLDAPAMAEEAQVVACTYDLILDKKDAGDIFLERQAGDKGTIGIGTAMEVKVSGWWGSWHLRSSGRAVADGERLLRFDHRITEDNKAWRITGEYADKAIWCSAREVSSKQAKEEDELTGLALSVAAAAIPYAGLVMGLLREGDGLKGDQRIPGDQFDTTAMELPRYLLNHQTGLGETAVGVLDTGQLEIKSWHFSPAGQEVLALAGREFSCWKFSGKSDGEHSLYWVARDKLGAFVVRETGKDKDGPYEIRLKSYKTGE